MSIARQCALLDLPRASFYYEPQGESAENLLYMRLIDEEYTRHPFYGTRRITEWLKGGGYPLNRKRVGRLMRIMGLAAIYPGPRLSQGGESKKYPYLLRNMKIERPNQVWCTDITYIRLREGFVYLTAVMDWFSRYVLSWKLSTSLEVGFCLEALEEALQRGRPEIFNSDQGVQFTCNAWIETVEGSGALVSMDGRGRWLDNVFIERLWRSLKCEDIYLKDYRNLVELEAGVSRWMNDYNHERIHQSLGYGYPWEEYRAKKPLARAA